MGLRDRRRGDESPSSRYQMREQLLSIGDDYWIEDGSGRRAFKVDGKAVRVRDTFVLRDAAGNEAAKIQERAVTVRDTMEIERAGGNATVHKNLVGLRDRFKIEVYGGSDLSAHGNLVDHEYEIERDGDTIATVSKSGSASGTPTGSRSSQDRRGSHPGHHGVHRRDDPRLSRHRRTLSERRSSSPGLAVSRASLRSAQRTAGWPDGWSPDYRRAPLSGRASARSRCAVLAAPGLRARE